MRFRTLEIRWHDSKPISTCDFQPVSFKKARPAVGQEKNYASQAYRLATGGEDNHVRIWMVHPHLRPSALFQDGDAEASSAQRPPRVEYLATLSRHSAAVNVVRFSPNGELIASAGDDGMIIIWAPSATPPTAAYGSDLNSDDLQHEREFWKPRTTFRCTTMQVYDLAWSPTGEYIIAGSTDNTARVFTSTDGKCVHEIAEHSHYVQGVAWDPLNEYIATQSSDRSMHIYHISTKPGGVFEAHAVGKNTRMPHRHSHSHSRTPSTAGRPSMFRRESNASDLESSSALTLDIDDSMSVGKEAAPLTPATSVGSAPAFMFPPPPIEASVSSRRSSFSSAAPGSPSTFSNNNSTNSNTRYGRSPSPMPPLPAIRSLPSPAAAATAALWASVKLYGDESYTNFFRRLTFSPDGGLLLTPAGQFEDPSVNPASRNDENTPSRGRRGHPSESAQSMSSSAGSTSSVYIYSRANFARPPIAQLPGHKKASVAVRFSSVLYDLRPNVAMPGSVPSNIEIDEKQESSKKDAPPSGVLERGFEGAMDVDISGPVNAPERQTPVLPSGPTPMLTPQRTPVTGPIAVPTPRSAAAASSILASSPALSPMELRPPTPAASKPSTPIQSQHHSHSHSHSQPLVLPPSQSQASVSGSSPQIGSVFALPYRLLFAVVTMDTLAIYDTQQAGPLAILTKLHYDEFTDMTWSPDGQCLMLSSRDGYCTLIMLDDILPAYHTQQHTLQIQSIAHHHSVPLTYTTTTGTHVSSSTQVTPAATPISASIGLPFVGTTPVSATMPGPPSISKKRSEPPLTPAASVDGRDASSSSSNPLSETGGGSSDALAGGDLIREPPKKKRRVALTKVGELDS